MEGELQAYDQKRIHNLPSQEEYPWQYNEERQIYPPVNDISDSCFSEAPPDYDTVVSQPFDTTSQQQPYSLATQFSPAINQQNLQHADVVVIDSQPTQQQEEQQKQTQSYTLNKYLKWSIILTLFFLFCGGWLPLIVSITAIFYAASAHHAMKQGDLENARRRTETARNLTIGAFIAWVITFITVPVALVFLLLR